MTLSKIIGRGGFWYQRTQARPFEEKPNFPSADTDRIQYFREEKDAGRIPRKRAKSKQRKDATRLRQYEEKQRILNEAFYDNVLSIGEVDALTNSKILGVNRAEVLRDPKLRYVHPALRDW